MKDNNEVFFRNEIYIQAALMLDVSLIHKLFNQTV